MADSKYRITQGITRQRVEIRQSRTIDYDLNIARFEFQKMETMQIDCVLYSLSISSLHAALTFLLISHIHFLQIHKFCNSQLHV